MNLTEETLRFIREHSGDNIRTLALQAHKYPAVDMPVALTQIAGHQVAREKIPTWSQTEGLFYPAHLPLEQCSSEMTARYKADIVAHTESSHNSLTDLTGGFGIDCAFLAPLFRQVCYVERQETLCETAMHNFPLLGLKHITIQHADSIGYLQTMPVTDWIFIDPARRDNRGGKTVAIADCEPDVSDLEELLLQKAGHVLVKLSPMLDLTLALNSLHHVHEVYIVSTNNECKELLLLLKRSEVPVPEAVPIHCVNLSTTHAPQCFSFTRLQEQHSICHYTSTPGAYLYEPNTSLLKAGAFRCLASIYKVEKLHPNSHLYTSQTYLSNFPGRQFRIVAYSGFGNANVRKMLTGIKQANLTVRNFPASVAELRKRLKLAEGGNNYLFATTLGNGDKVLLLCQAERNK